MSTFKSDSQLVNDCVTIITPLEQTLVKFLLKNEDIKITSTDYMKAYDIIAKLTNQGSNKEKFDVHDWYCLKIKEAIQVLFINNLEGKDDDDFLSVLIQQWRNMQIYAFWMFQILKVYDDGLRQTRSKSFYGSFIIILSNQVHIHYKEKLHSIFFKYLNSERDGNIIPVDKMIKICQQYVDLGFQNDVVLVKEKQRDGMTVFSYQHRDFGIDYKNYDFFKQHLLDSLLDNTKQFYENKANQWQLLRTSEFVSRSQKSIDQEYLLCEKYFNWCKDKYIEVIDQQLILEKSTFLVQQDNGGLKAMLKEDKIEEIQNLYKLYNRKPEETFKIIAQELRAYVLQEGNLFGSDEKISKDPLLYTDTLIKFKNRMDNIVKEILGDNIQFQNARDDAFKSVINGFDKSTRFLAMFTDSELKSKLKGATDEESEIRMNNIMDIFLYLFSKDQYIEDYSRYLSKRLLNQQSVSDEWEEKMISKLKAEVSLSGVQKLITMCQDMKTSKEKITIEFKEILKKNQQLSQTTECNFTILTKSFWPIKVEKENIPIVPSILQPYVVEFEKYYSENFGKQRILQVIMTQGTSEINSYLNGSKKILIVTNVQVCLLLQFNNIVSGKMSVSQICQATNIKINEIREHLLSLVKMKVLMREGNDLLQEIKDNEIISVNDNFEHKQTKIKCIPGKDVKKKIVNKDSKEQAEEEQKINEDLQRYRNSVIDAKIVMIMKSKRDYTLNEIIQDCMQLIKLFKPQAKDIKRRIESLIERDYLKRDAEDNSKFIYLP